MTAPTFTGDFAQTTATTGNQPCTGSLASGASCQLTVAFAPTTAGTRSGSVSFSGATAMLSGTGTADPGLALNPAALTFLNVPGPSATTQTIRLTNTGTALLTIGTPTTGSAAFTPASTCSTLAPATTCNVSVTYTPGPALAADTLSIPVNSGTYTVALTGAYTSANAGLQIVPVLSTFGPTSVVTQGQPRTLTVNNLTAKAVSLNVDLPRQYQLTGAPCTTLSPNGSCSFTVVYFPLLNGEAAGTVVAQATPADGSAAFNGIGYLEAYGAGTSVLTISGAVITNGVYNFGQVASGQTASQLFSLTNKGATPLTIRRVTSAPPFLATTTCGNTLLPTQFCTATVTYQPTNQVATGTVSPGTTSDAGSLAIESDAASSPDVISLIGQAGAVTASNPGNAVALATYQLSQNSLTFASTSVGNASPTQAVTLTNTGSVTLHVQNILATADYTATSNCASVLAGSTCTLNVSESPATPGAHNASLEILSDSSTALEFLSLSGSATPAPLTLSPTALDFGSVTVGSPARLPVQVTNNGTAPITFTSITTKGDFTAGGTCPAPGGQLAPSATCTIQVTFTPAATSTRTGTLSIATSASTLPLTVSLTGIGIQSKLVVTPDSLAFGSLVVGVPASLFLTLTNNGTASITGLALTASADYSISIPCPLATLAPGASCTAQITFTPSAAGTRPGALTIVSSDPGSPLAVPLTGTGIQSGSFTLAVNGALTATATVTSGQPASYNLTVTPTGNFAGSVALTCAALTAAQYASCSIAPANLTLAGGPLTAVVTINTITSVAGVKPVHPGFYLCLLYPALLLARRRRIPALLMTVWVLVLAGCGSSPPGTSTDPNTRYTPAGSYQYLVTASSTSGVQITQTVTLSLTVNPR